MPKKWLTALLALILFGVIGFIFLEKQANRVTCEPAITPWNIDNFYFSEEHYPGYFPNVTTTQVCTFTGRVTKGNYFSKNITSDIVFYLSPVNGGWRIGVTDKDDDIFEKNMSIPVTIPYYEVISGMTSLDVWGPITSNSIEGDRLVGDVENPISTRKFCNSLSSKDHQIIRDHNGCWRYGFNCPDDLDNISDTPRFRGILTITEMTIGKVYFDTWNEIESMEFEVKFYLPENLLLE